MNKAQLEKQNHLLREQYDILEAACREIRQVARDCVGKGTSINHVWIIEKVTYAFGKLDKPTTKCE